ncbi:MAG: alcohol dehydrogenase, partial [Bacillota bacterium]
MKAIAITPGKGEARLIDRPEVNISSPDEVKLKVLQVGICGTDREETSGGRADAPLGSNELVIGHEMF